MAAMSIRMILWAIGALISIHFGAFAQAVNVERWQSGTGGPPKAHAVPIQSAADWKGIWALYAPDRPLPPFEPGRHMGLAVALGRKPTTGYAVELVSIGPGEGKLVIELKEVVPTGQIVGQAITSPWLILRFDRTNMPLKVVGLDVAGFKR